MGDVAVETSSTLVFFVNGKKVVDDRVEPEWTLLYYLRNKLRLCGTKLGCAEGGCGACTVMVSKLDRSSGRTLHMAVNACLAPVCSMHGLAVTTVEGIGSCKSRLHPVQERLARSHGSQCGFCTPGIVMSMYALLRSLPRPSMDDLDIAFQGNLCRCTGYRPIIEGFKSFVEDWEVNRGMDAGTKAGCTNGSSLGCKKANGKGGCCMETNNSSSTTTEITQALNDQSNYVPYDSSQEPIFPPELKLSDKLDQQFLVLRGERVTWYRPRTLDDLLNLKAKFPTARIVVGNTEVGVEVKFKNCLYPIIIQPSYVSELISVKYSDTGVKFGSAVTLSEVEETLKMEIKNQPSYKTRVFTAIIDMLHWFAGKQIRNVAGVGGNIMTGSPISDLNPIFTASGCILEVQSKEGGLRTVTMDHNFFTGYRKNVVQPDEVLLSITVPYTEQEQYFMAYKQAKRRDDDIAIVNSAINISFQPGTNKVKSAALAFGGMAPTTVLAVKTAQKLIGKEFDEKTLEEVNSWLIEELPLQPGAPGGMIQFRRSLTLSFFFKFYLAVRQQRDLPVPEEHMSATRQFHNLPMKSSQYYEVVPEGQAVTDSVGRPMPHKSAFKQASGEAVYCDDIPHYEDELYLSVVTSTRAHANILSIDATEALALPGVHAFFSAKDIDKEHNKHGAIVEDEEIFASKKVTAQGQILGAIVADNQLLAQRASKLVKVEYQDISPIIITIEDAIEKKSFFERFHPCLSKGDINKGFAESEAILEGTARMGGQEHFYLETNCTLAIPKGEDDEMEIFCSTQNPSEIQKLAAHMLGIPFNRVVCRVKRIGGGFGGKESRTGLVALPVTLAAHRLNRPVRCMLDRDEDMVITGGRNPFLANYKVGFTKSGKLTACQMKLYNNAGNTVDLSCSVMDRAVFHMENAYNIPNIDAEGFVCKTNLPSNTAFRGFGGPQSMFMAENYIEDVANYLKMDPAEVRRINLYKTGDKTHYNQVLDHCTLEKCWDQCMLQSNYQERKKVVEEFNKLNRYKKRGINILPTKFGIAFTTKFLNQSGALVHVYNDGSVLISHGGTEMGQGLHTKMIQVASRALGVAESEIHISETSTDKVPNTSPTAASAGSDLNGMAIIEACEIIVQRLAPYRAANPKGNWKTWVSAAYFDRVSLSATGFHGTPDIGFDWSTKIGKAFNYFTYGVACSEVEIDCLTGDHQVLRTDIVMDLGESINPAIDIGQIEGAFVQGYGMFTLEEVVYSPTGTLYSRGPGMYKLPGFADIPAEFNVALLRGAPNPRAVYSSKAVGEPPLFLSASVFFAIKAAITSARADAGLNGPFSLYSPATAARIRMACDDHITAKFPEAKRGTFTPWNVEA